MTEETEGFFKILKTMLAMIFVAVLAFGVGFMSNQYTMTRQLLKNGLAFYEPGTGVLTLGVYKNIDPMVLQNAALEAVEEKVEMPKKPDGIKLKSKIPDRKRVTPVWE